MALPLDQIVTLANRVFCESALAGQYATLICGQATPSGEVEIHNAGHLPAIMVGHNGVRSIESTGLPLGMFMDVQFSPTRLRMQAGDTLLLYTDGLSEARNQDEEYGLERITKLAHLRPLWTPTDLVSACLDDLNTFVGSGTRLDDLTVLAIQRHS